MFLKRYKGRENNIYIIRLVVIATYIQKKYKNPSIRINPFVFSSERWMMDKG
jgi:hypothetical protein